MSLFNLPVPLKEKPVSHHPWERIIKGEYTNYKYGHATAKNPISYPIKKEKRPNSDQIKFTIIGNRLTEEFIYCTKLVNGLHKFRWKSFAAPVIQSVSSVEWPEKWRELKIRFGGLAYCLPSQVAVLMNDNFLGGEKELKEFVEAKYSYHIRPDYYKEGIKLFYNFIKSSGRPCVYMHISIDEEHIGTLIFMLYSDIVPRTCDNFLRLCTEKRGGYSGTPVHRIVKDCWIQCGGFGLKGTDLDCENFIVPHDKRGVLGMANDGRHVDCSTQFFVLLQPAPWMASRYVAFGQLIDGEETLKKIEEVDTWWESPRKTITIYKSGLFNMDCHYRQINKMTNEYIQGHIENLALLGKLFYALLLDKVFLTIELREIERMEKDLEAVEGEGLPEENVELTQNNIRATERFIRRKEEIEKQLQRTVMETQQQVASVVSGPTTTHGQSVSDKSEPNKEFDVDVYQYEPEEYSYTQALSPSPSLVSTLPDIPYYIELTDVPYPGEVDSIYNLKKMLKGDYCLQGDLDVEASKKWRRSDVVFNSEVFEVFHDADSDANSNPSLDSEDERAISKYIRENVDRISFAGSIIKSIARAHAALDIFNNQSGSITDGSRRKIKMSSGGQHSALKKMFNISEEVKEHEITSLDHSHRHISISVPDDEKPVVKIKRRQTGYIRPEDLKKYCQSPSEVFNVDDDDDDDDGDDDDDNNNNDNDDGDDDNNEKEEEQRKVRIASQGKGSSGVRPKRRSTFERNDEVHASPSALNRLFIDSQYNFIEEQGPTLKDYKPISECGPKASMYLTYTPPQDAMKKSEEGILDKLYQRRRTLQEEHESIDQVLRLQHGAKVYRKQSTDYVKTIGRIEQKVEKSIRTIEFARTRPCISVSEYQEKNLQYDEQQKLISQNTTPRKSIKTEMVTKANKPKGSPLGKLKKAVLRNAMQIHTTPQS